MNRLFLIIFTIALATGCSGGFTPDFTDTYEKAHAAN